MNRYLPLVCLLASVPTTAAAAPDHGPCSQAELRPVLDQQVPTQGLLLCQLAYDANTAQVCLDSFESLAQMVQRAIALANQTVGESPSESQDSTGPRLLGEHQWKTGTLHARQTFTGPAILSDTYRLEVENTGEHLPVEVRGHVCFFAPTGRPAAPAQAFAITRNAPRFDHTFSDVSGLVPVVVLSQPPTQRGPKYRIRGNSGEEPRLIANARALAAGKTAQ